MKVNKTLKQFLILFLLVLTFFGMPPRESQAAPSEIGQRQDYQPTANELIDAVNAMRYKTIV